MAQDNVVRHETIRDEGALYERALKVAQEDAVVRALVGAVELSNDKLNHIQLAIDRLTEDRRVHAARMEKELQAVLTHPKVRRSFELRRYLHPGKYENGLEVDVFLDNSYFVETTTGDVDTSEHYGLIRGPLTPDQVKDADLTADEREYLQQFAGAIVATNSQGFVTVTHYDSDAELQKAWEQVSLETEAVEFEDFSDTDLALERARDMYSEG